MSAARRQQREERRAAILEAAGRLITRTGMTGLSMRLLAKEVGIPAPTLYGYFSSKDAVIQALTDEKIVLLREAILDEAREAEPGVPRLMAFARGYRAFAYSGRDYYDLFMMQPDPEARRGRHHDHETGFDLIRTLAEDVQAAIDLGQVRPVDPEQTILALWTVAHGYVSLELAGVLDDLDPDMESRERTYLLWFESMLRGLEICTPGESRYVSERSDGRIQG
jgi:AcrR family transcriptional regulator